MDASVDRPRTQRLAAGDFVARRLALLASALCALVVPVAACPSCSLGQAIETLALVMMFMLIPYVVVSGVWMWIRALLARESSAEPPR